MTPVAEMVGSNRVVPGNGIVHPLGDAAQSAAEERALRRTILERALQVLTTPVTKPH
jgi:glycine reductase complex component B subunit gamma